MDFANERNLSRAVVDTLAESGVTTAEVEQLQKQVGIARDLLPALRTLVVDRANATEQLSAEPRAQRYPPTVDRAADDPAAKAGAGALLQVSRRVQRIEYHGGRADDSTPEAEDDETVSATTAGGS